MATELTLRATRPTRRVAGPLGLAITPVTIGLLLSALAGAILAQGTDRTGPDVPGAQQLIDRLRQIQGEIGGAQAGGGEDRTSQGEPSAPSAQGRVERPQATGTEARAAQVPAPELSEDQVRSRLQDELGVEVVGVRVVEVEGRPAYAVKVMNPPGNYNAAFLVSSLLIDGETGEIIAQSPGHPTMADPDLLPESFRPEADASGVEVRRRTYR